MAEPKRNLLGEEGVDALCGHVKALREFQSDFAEATARALTEADAALCTRQPMTRPEDLTIPTDSWATDNTVPGYPSYIDVSVPGLSGADIVAVYVKPSSSAAAKAANFFGVTESFDGKLRLRAASVPSEAIHAEYHITKTQAEEEE